MKEASIPSKYRKVDQFLILLGTVVLHRSAHLRCNLLPRCQLAFHNCCSITVQGRDTIWSQHNQLNLLGLYYLELLQIRNHKSSTHLFTLKLILMSSLTYGFMSKFSGLISLCITLFLWQNSIALSSWYMYFRTASGSSPLGLSSKISSKFFSIYSKTR